MKNDLVFTKGQEVFTSSKIVADLLGIRHRELLKIIDKIMTLSKNNTVATVVKFKPKFIKTTQTNKMGRNYTVYQMNEQAYMKLIMQLSNYKKAYHIQDLFIEAFSIMKETLNNQQTNSWTNIRSVGKQVRRVETDVIKEFVEYATKQGSKSAGLYYMNITKMTNKGLELIIQDKASPIRDLATAVELGFISVVNDRVGEAINDGMLRNLPYKEIYRYAKEEANKLIDSLAFRRITS